MADSGLLLRMLEPAVRPVAAPEGRSAPQPTDVPIEQRSFESLLSEARGGGAMGADEELSVPAAKAEPVNLLGPLSQVGAIENTSLRALVERGSVNR
ncbi:MAG: hypothetical protein WD534_13185 [Phycisphaeraceae bacterium]